MGRGTNITAVGEYNRSIILDAIRKGEAGMTRSEIRAQTGLAYQTVFNVTKTLEAEGLVRETERAIRRPGKPAVVLQFVHSARCAIGVHIDPWITTIAVVGLDHRVLTRFEFATDADARGPGGTARVIREVLRLLDAAAVRRDDILGVGIVVPGPIDRERGRILAPPLMPGWQNLDLAEDISAGTGLPVLLDRDVVAAAVGERWAAPEIAHPGVAVVYYGTGIGMCILLHGEVLRGGSFQDVGNLGWLVVPVSGAIGPVGGTTHLGYAVTPWALVQAAQRVGLLPPVEHTEPHSTPGPLESIDIVNARFRELVYRGLAGEAPVRALFDVAADTLALAVRTALLVINVERVVFTGPNWGRFALIGEGRIRERLRSRYIDEAVPPVEYLSPHLGQEGAAIGAATLIFDDRLIPRPDRLPFPSADSENNRGRGIAPLPS